MPWNSLSADKLKWKQAPFGSQVESEWLTNDTFYIPMGYPLAGFMPEKTPVFGDSYELNFEARRLSGLDFFVGCSFPVKDKFCTLIVGGWAGAVTGISSIDEKDAASNEHSLFYPLDNERWYSFHILVQADRRIQVFIDDKRIIDADIKGKEISTRPEVEAGGPFGFCSFETEAEVRQVRWRPIEP